MSILVLVDELATFCGRTELPANGKNNGLNKTERDAGRTSPGDDSDDDCGMVIDEDGPTAGGHEDGELVDEDGLIDEDSKCIAADSKSLNVTVSRSHDGTEANDVLVPSVSFSDGTSTNKIRGGEQGVTNRFCFVCYSCLSYLKRIFKKSQIRARTEQTASRRSWTTSSRWTTT